jgi:hypothetical protein
MRAMRALLLGLCLAAGLGGCAGHDPYYDTDGDGVRDALDCAPSDPEVFQTNNDVVDPDGLDANCDGIDGVDRDGDGYASLASGGDDCQDQDEAIHPDAQEVPGDWVDNDCTGGDAVCDSDGDLVDSALCDGPDCDDSNSLVQPGADELCDGLDTDCDGAVPDDELDADGDGVRACAGDCDDGDPDVSPSLAEACDRLDTDCDGAIPDDELDADVDGWPVCAGDCDDLDPARHPEAAAVCEGLDTDCDGALESGDEDEDGDGDPACTDCDDDDGTLHLLDLDADGTTSCDGDCNDLVPSVRPGGVDDWGDGVDGDCDGADGVDDDGDGWAANGVPADCLDDPADAVAVDSWPGAPDTLGDDLDQGCDGIDGVDDDGDGVASEGSGGADCNDAGDDPYAAQTFPGAEDLVGNGLDTNCDGLDGVDADADGHPSIASGGDDCSDDPADPAAASTFPGAPDPTGDTSDTDCDGVDGVDADGDGFASEASGGTDCNDDSTDPLAALTFVGAEDLVGNGADTDCDGTDGVDADGDGVASPASGGTDCNDDPTDAVAPETWPGAPDTVGDGVDQGCDGIDGVDDDCDGVASTGSGGTDCLDDGADPLSRLSFPAAADGWGDGADTNCDGMDGVDSDGDGFAINAVAELQDCDDDHPLVYPDSDALPGWQSPRLGLDEDCDGHTWEELAETGIHLVGGAGEAGTSVASAGDVDGDGLDDVIVGAPAYYNAGGSDGTAYVVLASTLAAGGTIDLANADAQIIGEHYGDKLGAAVAGVGDVDGGGLDDVLVGARSNDEAGSYAGQAYLFRGEDLVAGGTFSAADAWASFPGQAPQDSAGVSVAGVGDVDGDGLADLLIGAQYNDAGGDNAGSAHLVLGSQIPTGGELGLGSAHAIFIGEEPNDYAGWFVAGPGDVDGDGLDDVVVSAPFSDANGNTSGSTYLFFGASVLAGGNIDLSQADLHIHGGSGAGSSGRPVAGAGDIDGDGLADLVIGAGYTAIPEYNLDKTILVFGATAAAGGDLYLTTDADVTITGDVGADRARWGAGAGDVDGDGLDDLLVGAPTNSDGSFWAGKTSLFLGSTLGTGSTFDLADADAAFIGENYRDESGEGPAPAGDVDGDGFADFLIGAAEHDDGGKAYVVLSPW